MGEAETTVKISLSRDVREQLEARAKLYGWDITKLINYVLIWKADAMEQSTPGAPIDQQVQETLLHMRCTCTSTRTLSLRSTEGSPART